MKKEIIAIIIMGALLLIAQNGFADNFEKKYHQEYEASQNTILHLNNRYGNMHIENWDKNTIEIDILITVKTSNLSKASKTLDKIDIKFSVDGYMISAITEITESIRNTDFNIDYKVKIPKYINVDLYNKYGNLFLNELSGHANINVKYGSFSINKLTRGNTKPLNYVSVGYSDGTCDIEDANWLKLEIKYSKVSINKAIALMIDSKYSSVKIKKTRSIVAESKYDHPFKVGYVRNFICTGGYSDFEINKLYNKLSLDLKYSNVELNDIDTDFELIKINLKYGKARLIIPEGLSYNLKAEAAYGSINHPNKRNLSKIIEGTESRYWGIVGSETNPKAKIIINSKYGNVSFD